MPVEGRGHGAVKKKKQKKTPQKNPTSPLRHCLNCTLIASGTFSRSLFYFLLTLLYHCHHSMLSRFAGFVGKNCEVDVDACALASSTCPPKTECVDLPHGLRYTCRVPCPLNLQVGSNHDNYLRNISFGTVRHLEPARPSFRASARFVPNFHS